MRTPLCIKALLIGFAGISLVSAQGVADRSPSYDVKSEVVVAGKVAAVAVIPDWMGKKGVNVTLQTPESVMIHVDTAPADFLKMLDFPIAAGDDLEVAGVWSQWDGNRVFLAGTVTRHKVAVCFRGPDGKVVW